MKHGLCDAGEAAARGPRRPERRGRPHPHVTASAARRVGEGVSGEARGARGAAGVLTPVPEDMPRVEKQKAKKHGKKLTETRANGRVPRRARRPPRAGPVAPVAVRCGALLNQSATSTFHVWFCRSPAGSCLVPRTVRSGSYREQRMTCNRSISVSCSAGGVHGAWPCGMRPGENFGDSDDRWSRWGSGVTRIYCQQLEYKSSVRVATLYMYWTVFGLPLRTGTVFRLPFCTLRRAQHARDLL